MLHTRYIKYDFPGKFGKSWGVGVQQIKFIIVVHIIIWLLCLIIMYNYHTDNFMHATLTSYDFTQKYSINVRKSLKDHKIWDFRSFLTLCSFCIYFTDSY